MSLTMLLLVQYIDIVYKYDTLISYKPKCQQNNFGHIHTNLKVSQLHLYLSILRKDNHHLHEHFDRPRKVILMHCVIHVNLYRIDEHFMKRCRL